MSLSDLAYSVASFAHDFDPYDFADNFDSFADAVSTIADLLQNDAQRVSEALESMVLDTEDTDEQNEGASLLLLVRGHAVA